MSVCLSLPSSIPTLRMKEEEEEADGDRISGSALLPAGKSVSGPPFLPPAAASDHPGFFAPSCGPHPSLEEGERRGLGAGDRGQTEGKSLLQNWDNRLTDSLLLPF